MVVTVAVLVTVMEVEALVMSVVDARGCNEGPWWMVAVISV